MNTKTHDVVTQALRKLSPSYPPDGWVRERYVVAQTKLEARVVHEALADLRFLRAVEHTRTETKGSCWRLAKL
jgi:hypothetical protein